MVGFKTVNRTQGWKCVTSIAVVDGSSAFAIMATNFTVMDFGCCSFPEKVFSMIESFGGARRKEAWSTTSYRWCVLKDRCCKTI